MPSRLLILLFAMRSVPLLGCEVDPDVNVVGPSSMATNELSVPGDEYEISCRSARFLSAIVTSDYLIEVADGSRFDIRGLTREAVLERLRKSQTMINTPKESLN